MRKNILLLLMLFAAGLFAQGQYMMMSVEGQAGKFRAECTRSGYTDKTEVLGYQYEIKSPRDVASGQAAGRRQHQPLIIWKHSGASSPQFFQALTKIERIKKVTLEYYRPDDVTKQPVLSYTITLTNVSVTEYRQVMGLPDYPEYSAKTAGMFDQIKFSFEKITVKDDKAGTESGDSWTAIN